MLAVDTGLRWEESLFDEFGALGVDDVTEEAGFVEGTVGGVAKLGFADVSSVGILRLRDVMAASCGDGVECFPSCSDDIVVVVALILAALESAEADVVVGGEGEEDGRRESLRGPLVPFVPFAPFVPLAPWVASLDVTTGSDPMSEKTGPGILLPLVIIKGR